MLLYFAITCVVNLCVGYILGVYIGVLPGLCRRVYVDEETTNEWTSPYDDHHTFALGDPEPVVDSPPKNPNVATPAARAELPTELSDDELGAATVELKALAAEEQADLGETPTPAIGPTVEAPILADQLADQSVATVPHNEVREADRQATSEPVDPQADAEEDALEELLSTAAGAPGQASD